MRLSAAPCYFSRLPPIVSSDSQELVLKVEAFLQSGPEHNNDMISRKCVHGTITKDSGARICTVIIS